MWLGVLLLLALLTAALVRLLAGYPPAPGFRQLAPREVALLRAVADALYPAGGALPPSGSDARVAERLDGYLDIVPPHLRRLMRLLFVLMEHATLAFPGPAPRGRRRFSALSHPQQAAVLDGWRTSGWFPRRLVFSSLRALMTNAYVADPAVLAALGLTPFAIESPVAEADLLYPPIGRPRSAIRHAAVGPASDGTPLALEAPRQRARAAAAPQ